MVDACENCDFVVFMLDFAALIVVWTCLFDPSKTIKMDDDMPMSAVMIPKKAFVYSNFSAIVH